MPYLLLGGRTPTPSCWSSDPSGKSTTLGFLLKCKPHFIKQRNPASLKTFQSASIPWEEKSASINLSAISTEYGYKIQSCATAAETQIGVAPHKIPTSPDYFRFLDNL
jgi:hypothetical protein